MAPMPQASCSYSLRYRPRWEVGSASPGCAGAYADARFWLMGLPSKRCRREVYGGARRTVKSETKMLRARSEGVSRLTQG